jgi:N6-adenosine-specific RNA methylase IME4
LTTNFSALTGARAISAIARLQQHDLAAEIRRLAKDTVGNLLEIGRLLTEAKEALPHGEFEGWVESECRFSTRTARALMQAYRERKGTLAEIWYNEKRQFTATLPPALPGGDFTIVYADPPWRIIIISYSRRIENHYPTMDLEEIKKLKIPTAENAVLFLWSPACIMKDALEVMETWGFNYRTNAVWVKDRIGMGFYFRNQHELLLVGVKGEGAPPSNASERQSSVIQVPRSPIHSKKPELVYEIIESMYPFNEKIELFARQKRKGWTAWGNEVQQHEKPLEERLAAAWR